MMEPIRVPIQGQDYLTPAFQSAMAATDDLQSAIKRLLEQAKQADVLKEARAAVEQMSDADKQAALSVFEYDDALKKSQAEQERAAKATRKTTEEAKDQQGAFAKLGGGLNDLVQNLTGFNLAQLSVVGGLTMAANEARKAVDEYYNYTVTVQKMADATGMATEEISRIIQVADDFRVEQSTVEQAMKLALQNGFTPTIENLAKLADQYNAITDPTERAAKMQEVFGRQWYQLVPLLSAGGKAIREASAGIEDGMIVTQKAAEEAKKYYEAMDAWNDAITGAKYSLVQGLLPALTDFINLMNKSNTVTKENNLNWLQAIPTIGGIYTLITTLLPAKEKDTKATEKNTAAIDENTQAVQQQTDGTYAYIDGLEQASGAENRYAKMAREHRAAVLESNDAAQAQIELQQRQLDAANNLFDAENKLADAQRNFAASVGGDAASALKEGWISADKYKEGLGLIDEVMGTHLKQQQEYKDALSKASQEYKTGAITGDQYKKKLTEIKDTYAPFNSEIEKATELVHQFQGALDSIPGAKVVHLRVVNEATDQAYLATGAGSGSGANSYEQQKKNYGFASGGEMTVPAGYPNDTYMVGLTSGEHIVVTPAGQTTQTSSEATTVYYSITYAPTINNAAEFEANADALMRIIKRKGALA